MQKDFLTITPDSGEGSQEVTVKASPNTDDARSTTITISGGSITRTIDVIQAQGRFSASVTGSIRYYNDTSDTIMSRLYLLLINSNDESSEINLCSRLEWMDSHKQEAEEISWKIQWKGNQTFTANKCKLIISSSKNENIDIMINGRTLIRGTFTSMQEVKISTVTISPGDILRISGTVRYS